jgi:hypothetical protein
MRFLVNFSYGLHRRRFGRMPQHPAIYVRLLRLPRRVLGVLVRQTLAHGVPLQRGGGIPHGG